MRVYIYLDLYTLAKNGAFSSSNWKTAELSTLIVFRAKTMEEKKTNIKPIGILVTMADPSFREIIFIFPIVHYSRSYINVTHFRVRIIIWFFAQPRRKTKMNTVRSAVFVRNWKFLSTNINSRKPPGFIYFFRQFLDFIDRTKFVRRINNSSGREKIKNRQQMRFTRWSNIRELARGVTQEKLDIGNLFRNFILTSFRLSI